MSEHYYKNHLLKTKKTEERFGAIALLLVCVLAVAGFFGRLLGA